MKKLSIFAALMVVMAGVALASTLNVPFFLDTSTDNATKIAGFIGVKETSGVNRTVTVIYTAINASGNPQNQNVTFFLGQSQGVTFTPRTTNSAETPATDGQAIPNMTIVGPAATSGVNIAGSAQIISAGTLSGRYQQINFTRLSDMVHVLLPQ